MSFLSLGKRLQPAKKVWKNFTSKLQSKLHKLQRSKTIKKPRNRINATPSLSLQLQPKRRLIKPSHTQRPRHNHHRCYLLQKRPAPVFIDDLFKQQPVTDGVECFQPAPAAAAASKGAIVQCPPSIKIKLLQQPSALPGTSKAAIAKCPPTARFKKIHHQPSALPRTSKEDEKGKGKTTMADDMWESLGLASPQMHGIDERAEEFITRFRAEMELQEKMARGLHNS